MLLIYPPVEAINTTIAPATTSNFVTNTISFDISP